MTRKIHPKDRVRPFRLNVNLDDHYEREKFLEYHEPNRGRALANRLGFRGSGCVAAADGLMNYACNKRAAVSCRIQGKIREALDYEAICDRIYREDIEPAVVCW